MVPNTNISSFLNDRATPPISNSKQKLLTDFFKPNAIQTSTSLSTFTTVKTHREIHKSTSLTNNFIPNMIRNKCISTTKCNYCPLLNTSGTITCNVTKQKFTTKTNITCRSSNLVYCIQCRTCNMQYVGQTKRTIMARFQGHFYTIKNAINKRKINPQQYKSEMKDPIGIHFSQPDHNGHKDIEIYVLAFITLAPKTSASLQLRLKVEKNWIHRLRCPAPLGLNIFD